MKSPFLKRHLFYCALSFLSVCNLNAQKLNFSEIGYNSVHSATTFGAVIEVQNYGNTPLDITGYSIEDPSTGYGPSNERTYLSFDTVGCGDDMILEPNEVVSIFRFLNKNSQTINLYTPDDKLVSSITWGDSPYFVASSEAGVWTNGPTPVVPDGGAIVNIGDGTSWLDWVAVSERTPCVAENNSGQTERKDVLVFQAENAKKAKAKLIKASDNSDHMAVSPVKRGSYLEWDIDVARTGIYDVFLNYTNSGAISNVLKGTITVNNENNSLVNFAHTTAQTENSLLGGTSLNEFTKVHLEKGTNTVRFTATENLKNNRVVIDYLGLVLNDRSNDEDEDTVDTETIASWLPQGYCRVQTSSAKDEWISNFVMGTIDNNSGSSVFTDFSELATEVITGGIYNFQITPAWSGTVYNEGYAMWIDYNGNGNFDDEGEKVVSRAPSRVSLMSGSFTIPEDAVPGATKMRVAMQYNGEPILACSPIRNGEIEEYTVVIKQNKSASKEVAIAKIKPAISLYPLPIANELNIDIADEIDSIEVLNMQGQQVFTASGIKKINLQSLPPGNFILMIKTVSGISHAKQISKMPQ